MMTTAMIYRPEWPSKARIYAGKVGPLPKVGDQIEIINAHDGESRTATVIQVHREQREYTVTMAAQLELEEAQSEPKRA